MVREKVLKGREGCLKRRRERMVRKKGDKGKGKCCRKRESQGRNLKKGEIRSGVDVKGEGR